MTKQFTLGKKERLKSRKLIEQLFSEGKNFSLAPYRIFYVVNKIINIQRSMFNVQFGVGVSGKNFRKAVDRNRVKRLTREAYRLQKEELQETLKRKNLQLNIFFIYTGKELPDFNTVKERLKLILKKLIDIADENVSSNS